jgi:hypothetical protein
MSDRLFVRRAHSVAGLAAAMATAFAASAQQAPAPRNVRYIDVHSHLFPAGLPGDDEIAAFRKAGMAGVLLMWPDPAPVKALAQKNPGYVVPWISLAALEGTIVTPETAPQFIHERDVDGFCGFGEMATRLPPPNPQGSDSNRVSDPNRMKIYDAADAKGTPMNFHISLVDPETLATVEKITTTHPHSPVIIAHGGQGISTETIARLLTDHPNMYFDLSGPLSAEQPGGPPRPQAALQADGSFKPEWRALLERFPDRFMFATDTQSAQSIQALPQKLAQARKAFAPLPVAVEEAVAHGNIEKVLKGCGGLTRR